MGSVGYCKVLDRDRNKQGSFLSLLQKAGEVWFFPSSSSFLLLP